RRRTPVLAARAREQRRPHLGLQLGILDPRSGFGEAAVERADIAHPEAERAAIGIEAPYADYDFVFDIALEARAVEQDALVLGRGLHRLPGDRRGAAQALDLGRGAPVQVVGQHGQRVVGRILRL